MPITFRKAVLLVILLHVGGGMALYGFLQYRSYRDKIARENRDREVIANYNNNPTDWNNQGKKLRVVAVPKLKPKSKIEEKSFKDYFIDITAHIINEGKELYGMALTIPPKIEHQTKDTVDKIEKKIKQKEQLKPAVKPRPTPRPTPFTTVIYKHTRVIEHNKASSRPSVVKEEMISTSVVPIEQVSAPRLRLVRPCPPPNFR